MTRAWKTKTSRSVVASLFAGLALAAAWLVAACVWGLPPRATAASTRGTALHNIAPLGRQVPLDCRLVPVGEAEQREGMEQTFVFQIHPELLTPRICRNPLVASRIEVEVENTSGRDFSIYTYGRPFWVTMQHKDADGNPVFFEQAPIGIKRLGLALPDLMPAVVLKPGQVERQAHGIFGHLTGGAVIKPGRYTVRAVCSYFRAPDGKDCRVESAPFPVTITEEHIREWRDLLNAPDPPGGVEEAAPQP